MNKDHELVEKITQHIGIKEKLLNFRSYEDTVKQVLTDNGIIGEPTAKNADGNQSFTLEEKAKHASINIGDVLGIRNRKDIESIIKNHAMDRTADNTIRSIETSVAVAIEMSEDRARHPNDWINAARKMMKDSGLTQSLEKGSISRQQIEASVDSIHRHFPYGVSKEALVDKIEKSVMESPSIEYDGPKQTANHETDFTMGWDNPNKQHSQLGLE